jgi:hypothetical protein
MRLSSASVLVAPVTILLLFASALVGTDRLGFRDVSHFYTPLYDYVAWRTSGQWLPLWNPLDETGIPLIGETTTAVFYPLRYVLFALPIATETALAWYVTLHLILASITAWWAARWSSAGPIAASIASVVYPLSGSLLFLYTNPPYLVGAAWLPLVLGVMVARTPISATSRIVIGGASMSMMILGGDPQTALHAMILVGFIWIIRLIRRSDGNLPLRVLIAAPCLAALLAIPQIAASVSWSRQSDRTDKSQIESWIDPPLVGGRRYEAFQFSLAPWHTLELATPNASGSLLPINQRISRLVPGDGRMWTPSIYMGMLVIVALLSAVGRARASGIDPWLAMAVASLTLAMGHFGLVWWVQTITGGMSNVDSAVGGPYWMLYQLLPGYDAFRYPAKWLTLFSLAAAIASGITIEQGLAKRTVTRVAMFLGAGLVAAFAVTILARWNPSILFDRPVGPVQDEFWGPLDIDGGLAQVSHSLIHSAIVLMAIVGVVRRSDSQQWSANKIGLCLLVITSIDLAIVSSSLIARVPRNLEHELIDRLASSPAASGSRWMRTQSGGGWPSVWKETRDPGRLLDVEASGRAAWFGRWHLADRAAVLNNMVSIRSRDIATFWRATRQVTAEMSPQQRDEFWTAIRDWLRIDRVLHTTAQSIDIPADGRNASLIEHQKIVGRQYPPLRVHTNWRHADRLEPTTQDFAQRLREITNPSGEFVPVVQSAGSPPTPTANGDSLAEVRQLKLEADIETFELHLEAASLLTRPVFQDGHWKSQYAPANSSDWQSVPVHRIDHLLQGVILPAGEWKLRFCYSPWWLGWSLAITGFAWIVVTILLVRHWDLRRTVVGWVRSAATPTHPL